VQLCSAVENFSLLDNRLSALTQQCIQQLISQGFKRYLLVVQLLLKIPRTNDYQEEWQKFPSPILPLVADSNGAVGAAPIGLRICFN